MPIGNAVCNARHINHVCLAVSNIEEALEFYKETFGIAATEIVDIKDQGVRAALVEVGGAQIEFIESTDPQNGVARFLENKGEGVHHICFEVACKLYPIILTTSLVADGAAILALPVVLAVQI